MQPGSMPSGSRSIFQEGLIIPPIRLVHRGEHVDDVWRLILANVRTPELRRADLNAQLAACRVGATRLAEMFERHGATVMTSAFDDVLAYSERQVRTQLEALPDGVYQATTEVEGDGITPDDILIRCSAEIVGDRISLRLHGYCNGGGGQRQLPARRHLVRVPVRAARPPAARGAHQRGHRAHHRADGAGGVACQRQLSVRGRRRQRRDEPAHRRRVAPRARSGGRLARRRARDDEQRHHRRRELDILRDDRGRSGREPFQRRGIGCTRRHEQHAEHARRGARARVPTPGRAVRAALRLGRSRAPHRR